MDSTTRVVGIVNEGTAAWEAMMMGGIYSLSFGYVIADVMILAPMESVCGKINMSSGT